MSVQELLAYQEVDAKLKKIESELSGSDERKKAVSAKNYIQSVVESVSKLDLKAAELALAFERATQNKEKLKEQEVEFQHALDGADGADSVTYLIKKTDEIIGKIKNLENEAAKISADIQSIMKEYQAIKAKTKVAQQQLAEYGAKYSELKSSRQSEREALDKELKKLEAKVPKDLMERYRKKRENKIFPILFEVSGKVCGACNMELPMSVLSKLKNGEVIECENCRRLLFQKQ